MLFYAAALQTLNYDWDTLARLASIAATPGIGSHRERLYQPS